MNNENFETKALTALICLNQLLQLKGDIDKKERLYGIEELVKSYNVILKSVKEAMSIDDIFVNAINHLQEYPKIDSDDSKLKHKDNLTININMLIGTLNTFVNLYLSKEKKEKIGFKV